jgi:hypothetical protein
MNTSHSSGCSPLWIHQLLHKSTTSEGVIHGKRGGIRMAGGSEVATFSGEGIGRFGSTGSSTWHGCVFFCTSSKDKLSFLNNLIGAFEG